MPKTQKDINRQGRKQSLRELLREQGHLQYAIENIDKIEKGKCSKSLADNKIAQKDKADMSMMEYNRLKTATELRLKLVAKYIPDLKSIEHSVGS